MTEWTEFTFILRPSPLGGVGVFATHDIPAGTEIFKTYTGSRRMKKSEVPEEFLKFCIHVNEDECIGPENFDHMEVSWFLNHSHEPNISKEDDHVYTLRKIQAGEEVCLNYNQLNEPEHLKEWYYK